MLRTRKVALGSFVLRTRESLCCIRPLDGALALSTMNRADEVLATSSLDLPSTPKPAERELAMAERLVESLSSPFRPERYPDEHRQRVLELVRRRAEGETIEAPRRERAPAQVVSLADALSASLAAARSRGSPSGGARAHRPAAAARTARGHGKKKRA
jgi:DNA end-binding protein Ku